MLPRHLSDVEPLGFNAHQSHILPYLSAEITYCDGESERVGEGEAAGAVDQEHRRGTGRRCGSSKPRRLRALHQLDRSVRFVHVAEVLRWYENATRARLVGPSTCDASGSTHAHAGVSTQRDRFCGTKLAPRTCSMPTKSRMTHAARRDDS